MATAPLRAARWLALLPFGAARLNQPRFPELCAEEVIAETCLLLSPEGGQLTPSSLEGVLSVSEPTLRAVWEAMDFQGSVSCESLCWGAVGMLRRSGVRMPANSDVGCYRMGVNQTECDVDLRPGRLGTLVPDQDDDSGEKHLESRHEHPALENVTELELELADLHSEHVPRDFSFGPQDLAVRVANLFRIYPALGTHVQARHAEQAADADAPPSWHTDLMRRSQEARAYVGVTLRRFSARKTPDMVKKWFGPRAVTKERDRKKIQHVVNSISNVISQVSYIYPGAVCERGDFGYVFSCDGGPETDPNGNFPIYLCDEFWKLSLPEQLITLTHEASHHAHGCTKDFRYGRRNSMRLAETHPWKALRNADNYGYYIRGVSASL